MKIGIANAAEIDALWPVFAEKLEKAARRVGSSMTSGSMWQLCRSGQAFLFVVMDDDGAFRAAIVMQFQTWADKQVFYCMAMVGDGIHEWLPMAREYIGKIGRENGAKSFISEGREGWAALFPDAKKLRITYEVPL